MEITGLGTAYLDDFKMSAGSPSAAITGQGKQDFSEILAKANAAREGTGTSARIYKNVEVDKTDKLYEQCLELETFLVKNLLTGMRNTIQKSGLIDEGFAGKMYEDMLYDEYAKDLTKHGGFGLAEQAYRQLKQYE
ncbi:MAG: rod-binding protein [Treponema sp.]|jgi:flagellar protein FlgJ|nr:rod-binding protein [Treponema sp.]